MKHQPSVLFDSVTEIRILCHEHDLYLCCMLGFAEERGLGSEESEVLALFIQAAVPAAHTVTAGHGGGHNCTDSHGEVLRNGCFNTRAAH